MNPGDNVIRRRSDESFVPNWFAEELDYYKRALKKSKKEEGLSVFGWPKNLLIPKGNADGFPCHLFAMITPDEVGFI